MEWWHDLEGAARWVLDESGADVPVDIHALAECCGFRIEYGTEGSLNGWTITVDRRLSHSRRRFQIAHELGHWAIRETAADCTVIGEEAAADWVAGALLIPLGDMRSRVKHRWDLAALAKRYGISWEATAKRLYQSVSSIVTVFDNGRVRWREQSPWLLSSHGRHPTRYERDLAYKAASTLESHVEGQAGAWVVPSVEDSDWVRVIVAVGIEQIEERSAG